ncbi:hypothetical protein SAY87_003990 [Trapa incisa]|uniref:Uncharacterized protein n=1 Tax=Trapa incisa TaxID=236973 RepID=A0AAN7JPB9_9MYRT|nr:hypothetical protein SAY87_003990 [Trapa incisa]
MDDEYGQMNGGGRQRGDFLYTCSNQTTMSFHLQSSADHQQCLQSPAHVKTEEITKSSCTNHHLGQQRKLRCPLQGMGNESSSSNQVESIKAKIVAHPRYSDLLEAYMDCQKIGAPPDVATKLEAARQELEKRQMHLQVASPDAAKDPELDQFMEAYCDMLVKYREELTRPLQEAMDFMRRIEAQLNILSNGPVRIFNSDDKDVGAGSSDDDQENSAGETELPEIDPRAEDRELKNHLLKKYSGYLGSLKQELSKKRKKGKLPKEARQKLLTWWEMHYKWPYPSESEKLALAESTGLDQKQINNWFINQRKRHWKPSEDMQFMVMEGPHSQNAAGPCSTFLKSATRSPEKTAKRVRERYEIPAAGSCRSKRDQDRTRRRCATRWIALSAGRPPGAAAAGTSRPFTSRFPRDSTASAALGPA